MPQPKLWVSVLITLVIGLHAVPAILRPGSLQVTWPFLVWGMYKESRGPGPITADRRRVVAIAADGTEQVVEADLSGLPRAGLGRAFVLPMMNGDTAAAQRLFQRINYRRSVPVVTLRVEVERYTISDTGLVRNDPPVLTYRWNPTTQMPGATP